MTKVVERQRGKRRLPICQMLKDLLWAAGRDAGIDEVIVFSGGQAPKGSGGPRTGSSRHDFGHSADIRLKKAGRILDFRKAADLQIIEGFVRAAASYGASGIGAGPDYMDGATEIHVGYGPWKVGWWGKDGKKANAPRWLKDAIKTGWRNPRPEPPSLERERESQELIDLIQGRTCANQVLHQI